MSTHSLCGDQAAQASYLYGECSEAERDAFDAHLAICAACAADIAALTSTRDALRSWTPPDAPLGFQIVSAERSAAVLRPARWWQRPLPAWAQTAAAVAIFAVGAGLGVTWRTPQPSPAASTVSATATPRTAAAPAAVSASDLSALERRLRAEMGSLRTATAPAAAPAATADERLLAQVRAIVAESERRQQQELALRLTQVMRDVDSQRRVDLSRIERTIGQMEGLTGAQAAEQRQMLNYLMRVSQRPQ